MTGRDEGIRPEEVSHEADKARRTIWEGEGLLWRLHQAAAESAARHQRAVGTPLPEAAGEGDITRGG